MTKLVRSGDAKGVRIPRALVKVAGLENVELEFGIVRGGLLNRFTEVPR